MTASDTILSKQNIERYDPIEGLLLPCIDNDNISASSIIDTPFISECDHSKEEEVELTLQKDEENDFSMCCVCLDEVVDPEQKLPCGHTCMCKDCTEMLAKLPRRNKCPFCRVPYLKRRNSLESMPDPNSIYLRLKEQFISDRSDNDPVICPCGEIMAKLPSIQAHGGYPVECDVCKKVIRGQIEIYHCMLVDDPQHPYGFDVCITCGTNFQPRGCFGRRRRSV